MLEVNEMYSQLAKKYLKNTCEDVDCILALLSYFNPETLTDLCCRIYRCDNQDMLCVAFSQLGAMTNAAIKDVFNGE